ncbi:MAG: AsmA family protein [Pseudomonadota bacterium]
MSRILFLIVALVGVALAVLLLAPGVIPVATYKPRIEAAASQALGRDVTIGDELSIRILPATAFRVQDLAIANEEGFEGETLARVREARIGVKLFPLLSGAVVVDQFVLVEPAINLIRKSDGSVNWNLVSGDAQPAEETEREASGPRDLRLGDVRIIDGRATFKDAAADRNFAAEDINVEIVLTSLAAPLEIDGDMVFQGQPADVDIVLTDLKSWSDGEPADLKLDMTVGETTVGADLTLVGGEAVRYQGPITFDAPDLPAFAALVGTPLADAPGFDRLSLKGDIDGGADAMRLSGARIGFDEIDAQGSLTLDWAGAKPKAGGVLSTELLDLRPYMPPPSTSAEGFPAWSEAPMDFTALRNIDASFDVSADQILLNDIEIGESRLQLEVENGRMTADIPELAMYGGQGSGRLVVNARGATPSFAGNFDMEAVNAQPLSLDVLKHDNLLGLGSFKLDFTASGASQAAIMSSVDGSGGFDLSDGALKGINIAKIAQAGMALRAGGINPAALANAVATARGPREETDFSEFLSDFSITDGLINAPTISLNGPFLTMTGAGQINLAAQTIDLRLAPRASTTADGVEGQSIAIPMRVGGTFAKPSVGIDGEALARAALQNSLGGFLGGADASSPQDAVTRALEGVFGARQPAETNGAAGQEGAETPSEEEPSVEEQLLRQGLGALFGGGAKNKEDEGAAEEDQN